LGVVLQDALQAELDQTQSNLHEANAKVSELERKCNMQQDQLFVLKENMAQMKAEHRLLLAHGVHQETKP